MNGIPKSPSLLHGFFFFQAEDGIRDLIVTGVQTCALPIFADEVLGGRDDMTRVQKRRTAHHTLQSADNATSVGPHDLGVLGVSLVRAPPPVIEIGRASCRERV